MVDRPETFQRDWWPLTRLILVVLGLFAASRVLPGWQEPGTQLVAFAGELIHTAVGLAILSPVAAHFYLGLALIPLLILVLLNDWIYEASWWALQTLFRLRSRRLLAGASLCSEAALFAGGFVLLHRFLSGF